MNRIESYKKGALLSVIFNAAAKGMLFLLTIVIARYFGSNIETDIYFFIYSTMILLSGFINAVDIAVLVPESIRIREQKGTPEAMAFLNYFFRLYLVIGLLFVALLFFFGTAIFGALSRFPAAVISTYRDYFLLGSFYFLFQVLTNYINNILTSLKYFTLPMIFSGLNSCIVIAGIVMLHREFEVKGILISGVAAYAINCIILLLLLKRTGWQFGKAERPAMAKTWTNIIYTELGQLATLASSYFPLYLLSGFNAGLLSSLNYGKNIADVPNTLITAQLSNVSGIKLNEEIAQRNAIAFNDTFVRTARVMVFVMVPLSFFLFLFAPQVAGIFYGNHVSSAALDDVAFFLMYLSVTGFCIAVNSLVARVFIAKQAIRQGFIYQLVMNGILIAVTWLLVNKYGAYGYAYAIVAVNLLNYILLYFICRAIAPETDYKEVLRYSVLIIIVNAAIGAGLYLAMCQWQVQPVVIVAAAAVVWLSALLLLNRFFRLNKDMAGLIQKLRSYAG